METQPTVRFIANVALASCHGFLCMLHETIAHHSFKVAVLLVPVIAAQLAMLYGLDDNEFDQDNEDQNPVLYRPLLLDASFDVRQYSD